MAVYIDDRKKAFLKFNSIGIGNLGSKIWVWNFTASQNTNSIIKTKIVLKNE